MTPTEAICQVFKMVSTGGVSLTFITTTPTIFGSVFTAGS